MNSHNKSFTLIELIIVIAIVGILAAFVISSLSGSRGAANDARRKSDISNLYKGIVGKQTLDQLSYPDLASTIKKDETNTDLQLFIDRFLKSTPYDPDPNKAYLYKGNGADFSIAAILDDGTCFIKSTGTNLFSSDVCSTYSEGGMGLVQDFSILHGSTYIDLNWSIPAALASLPSNNVSSAIVCLEETVELSENDLPSDSYLLANGTIVAIVNNSYTEYRMTLDHPGYYYYCKEYSYDNTIVTNPGTVGSAPNTDSSAGLTSPSVASADPETVTPEPAANPPSIGGGTAAEGSTSPSFVVNAARNPDNTGSITLSWIPGTLSTHTIIRRMDNTPPADDTPENLTEGTEVYNERNDKDGQDPTDVHLYTDTGLSDNIIYCYSAWSYDERTELYSNGFVLACGGIPPTAASSPNLASLTDSFNLSWTKGSASNTVIRRSVNTAPVTIEEGVAVYNGTASSFTDNDSGLEPNTTYCYSLWGYNSATASLSTDYISTCGTLLNLGSPANLTFPTVTYNSITLNWTKGAGSTKTSVIRKQGSVPTSRTDGTEIYFDNSNTFTDTGLADNTNYCYALYATDDIDYSEPLTGCTTTQEVTGLVSQWKFDEGTGTTAYDSKGSNNGTLYNSPTWTTSTNCISGSCLSFDGSDDHIIMGSDNLSSNYTAYTFSAWIKTSNSSGENILQRVNRVDQYSVIQLRLSSGRVNLDDYAPTGGGYLGSRIINDNNWHNVVTVRDGTIRRIYIDGIIDGTQTSVETYGGSVPNNIIIGADIRLTQNSSYFAGLIDDIRMYNKVLSQDEISSLHKTGNSYFIANGSCGSASGSSFYSAPTENLCSYGSASSVSGAGPYTWTCTGESASVSCSANKKIDGDCGSSANIEHASAPTTNLCLVGTASAVSGDGVPYAWTCTGLNGGVVTNCEATKTGWINTGLGFYVMKYEAKIQGNNNGNQAYSSTFVPESRTSGTPWTYMNWNQAVAECSSLGTGYHLITNTEWNKIARNIESVSTNWSGGSVGSGTVPKGYSSDTTQGDAFSNTATAPYTGPGYEYNTGANTVGASGQHRYKRTHTLSNSQTIWDLSGNAAEWINESITNDQMPLPKSASGDGGMWLQFSQITSWGSKLLAVNVAPAGNYGTAQGLGLIITDGNNANGGGTTHVLVRGGCWKWSADSGIFQTEFFNSPTSLIGYERGFRCAK